ncbi:MAG: hypothetical protein V5A43_02210 [Haloarculaceae archaeon]
MNALETARAFAEQGDEVELIFDGAGTGWIPELEAADSDSHELYRAVRDEAPVCDFCSGAFEVDDAVGEAGIVRLDDHDSHPSIRSLVEDGYDVITVQGRQTRISAAHNGPDQVRSDEPGHRWSRLPPERHCFATPHEE